MSLNPVCGAVSYTYTIDNLDASFSINGQKTLTTTDTYVDINFWGPPSINYIKAKVNFPNNASSYESITSISDGAVQPGYIGFILIDPAMGKIQAQTDDIPGANSYNWYKNGELIWISHGSFIQFPISRSCDIWYDVSVEAENACGISSQSHNWAYVPCEEYYMLSPNPATSEIMVSTNETKTVKTKNTTFDEIRIYDMQGNVKKYQKYKKVKQAKMNISGLRNGSYIVEIINGTYVEKKILLVQN